MRNTRGGGRGRGHSSRRLRRRPLLDSHRSGSLRGRSHGQRRRVGVWIRCDAGHHRRIGGSDTGPGTAGGVDGWRPRHTGRCRGHAGRGCDGRSLTVGGVQQLQRPHLGSAVGPRECSRRLHRLHVRWVAGHGSRRAATGDTRHGKRHGVLQRLGFQHVVEGAT